MFFLHSQDGGGCNLDDLDEAHNVPILHPLRYNRKKRRLRHDTDKWQDVLMAKPLPPHYLLRKALSCRVRRIGMKRIGRARTMRV